MTHIATVPVTSKAQHFARATTSSRRRRIIYESARRLTREYISFAIYNIETSLAAVRLIQQKWRIYRIAKIQFQDSVAQIHTFYKIIQAKKELHILRHRYHQQHHASVVITEFCRRRYNFRLTITCAILIQKHWRGALARVATQEAKLTLLEMECSAIVLQSFVRTYIAKRAFERRHYPPCALLIQRQFRLHLFRKRKREKLQTLMNHSSIMLQRWWRNMMIIVRMLVFAKEEMRLRLLLGCESGDDEINLADDAIPYPFADESSTKQEAKSVITSPDSDIQNESSIKSLVTNEEDNDSQCTTSSSLSTKIFHLEEDETLPKDENHDSAIIKMNSSSQSSTTNTPVKEEEEDEDEERRKAKELLVFMRQNQSASLLQNQIRQFIIKRKKENQIQRLKEQEKQQLKERQHAAYILTNKLLHLYQMFIAKRRERKRKTECKAAIVIQTYIRSILATRLVSILSTYTVHNILSCCPSSFSTIWKTNQLGTILYTYYR